MEEPHPNATSMVHSSFLPLELAVASCYSIRGTRTERPRRVVLQGPPMGVPYRVYLEHPLCVYCNVVPVVLHPLLHSLPYPCLLVPCDTIPGLQASLIPLPLEAAFNVGLDMIHQFVFTHQGKGRGRNVASSSPMQVLLEHPSTRKRKLTKLNDKDHRKVRSGGAI
jgi:hypothetical protein